MSDQLVTPRQERTSRWSRKPRIRNGQPYTAKPTFRDLRYIRPILERYDFLPADFIHALLGEHGGSYEYLRKRLPALATEPCFFLQHPLTFGDHSNGNYRKGVYGLPTSIVPHNPFHDLKNWMVRAQIEIGARDAGLDFITFDRILAKAPPPREILPTYDPADPKNIRLAHRLPGARSEQTYTVKPDDNPFGIGNGKIAWFFGGPEIDCGTEPGNSSNTRRQYLKRKISLALAMLEQQIAQHVYGLRTPFMYPIVLEEEADYRMALKFIFELTDGKGSPNIILNWYPSYNAPWKKDDPEYKLWTPDGSLFRSPWKRAGFPDFYMNQI